MILYHGFAVRWLHPDHMHEAVIVGETAALISSPSNEAAKINVPPAEGDQFVLMLLPTTSQPGRIALRNKRGGRKKTGHAGVSGQGPAGETCGGCEHYLRVQGGAGTFRKCALMRAKWTRGPGSDIRKSDPACQRWEAKQ